jgi:laccase
MVTQCPICPGHRYTYRFNITGQEGTLWWHAHSYFLRATVYGALIVKPRSGNAYPFPAPDEEKTVLLGEWWNAETVAPNALVADAYTINGRPGDSYSCETTAKRKRQPG